MSAVSRRGPGDESRTHQLRLSAWGLRLGGQTYEKIGELLEVSTSYAHRLVQEAFERAEVEQASLVVRQISDRFDVATRAVAAVLEAADPKGKPFTILHAVDRLLAIDRERRALLGLDAKPGTLDEGKTDEEELRDLIREHRRNNYTEDLRAEADE